MEINLRAVEPSDVDFLYNLENAVDTCLVSETIIPFSKDFIERYVMACMETEFFAERQSRLIVEKEGTAIGTLDLFNYSPIHRRAEVGIILDLSCRAKGIGGIVLAKILSYAKDVLNLRQLYAEVSVNNTVGQKLFSKAGFEHCGHKKDWLFKQGEWVDIICYQKIINT